MVRGAQGRHLGRRPQADDALADPGPGPGRGDGARDAEAGRAHAPAHAENSSPGQAIYDPVPRLGDQCPAAETCGRTCLGLELSRAYMDIIVERWRGFTGGEATLDGDGRAFADVRDERTAAAAEPA
jgi:hypothetical protein